MANLYVEIIQQEIIKPSSPTPPHFTNLTLSLIDQIHLHNYMSVLFFYPAISDPNCNAKLPQRSSNLKSSLSNTLTKFYPLAGRIKDSSTVECLDQGAHYTEARIGSALSGILQNPDVAVLKKLLPAAMESVGGTASFLLLVQASFFSCGGMAIGVCMTHKVADAATLNFFIRSWAETADFSGDHVLSPVFKGASFFPPIELPAMKTSLEISEQFKCVTKRFVFDGSKIKSLQTKISNPETKKPTRVESVCALIWNCAAKASRSQKGVNRPTVCTLPVNLRKWLEPPLPENYAGNFVGSTVSTATKDQELNVKNLFGLIRKGVEEFREKFVGKMKEGGATSALRQLVEDFGKMAMDSELDHYICSSWCRFELYGVDFGWGKPVWVTNTTEAFKNLVYLMDTNKDNGIEVWVTLIEEDMDLFETDQELLQFVVVNPAVV